MANFPDPNQGLPPLQKVVVMHAREASCSEADVLGTHGVVLLRDPESVRRNPSQPNLWQYTVLLQDGRRVTVPGSRLIATGRFVRPETVLGRGYEISFDRAAESEPCFTSGVYRLPGRFWDVFEVRRDAVQHPFFQLRIPVDDRQGDVHRLILTVPRDANVDAIYVLRAMRDVFGGHEWVEVQGPESRFIPQPVR